MVVGLDIFTAHFKDHTDQYILIGGGACDWHFEKIGLPFRVTKDLDIILVVEALTPAFVNHFWQFIKDGEYSIAEVGSKKQFYRFINPKTGGYPSMIELFSRVPDSITVPDNFHLTDIPTEDETSSLSAILLDDDYYTFTLDNSTVAEEGLRHASDIALIVLKSKAFLNNRKRKAEGQPVQQKDIDKHKKDVIRLIATINPDTRINTPDIIKTDLREYIAVVREENPEIKQFLKAQQIADIPLSEILDLMFAIFNLS